MQQGNVPASITENKPSSLRQQRVRASRLPAASGPLGSAQLSPLLSMARGVMQQFLGSNFPCLLVNEQSSSMTAGRCSRAGTRAFTQRDPYGLYTKWIWAVQIGKDGWGVFFGLNFVFWRFFFFGEYFIFFVWLAFVRRYRYMDAQMHFQQKALFFVAF